MTRTTSCLATLLLFSSCLIQPSDGPYPPMETDAGALDAGPPHRQDLVSGTRLKAITLRGADGSSAPVKGVLSSTFVDVFWDSLLNTYCFPFTPTLWSNMPGSATSNCMPLPVYEQLVYVDSTCTTPAGRVSQLQVQGLPTERTPQVATLCSVPGCTLVNVTPRSMPVYRLNGGTTCDLLTSSANYLLVDLGSERALSDVAAMTVTFDP